MRLKIGNKSYSSPLWSVLFFWFSCAVVIAGFFIHHPISYLLLMFIWPVYHGTHEALHDTLIPQIGITSKWRSAHNSLALLVGFGLQGMNFRLLRPSHLVHHAHGRYDEGYAPEIISEKISLKTRFQYYSTLIGLPALANQLAGFVILVFPRPHAIFKQHIPFDQEPSKIPFAVVQAFVASVLFIFVFEGGVVKFVVFEIAFCFMWSVFQNVAHYGLCGIDPATDRLCARTYVLEKPFRVLTFGSFSHFAHHVDMQIPGAHLHKREVLNTLENELGIELEIKRGICALVADLFRQFKGPLTETELSSSWIKSVKHNRISNSKRVSLGYSHRAGRKWLSIERQT